MKTLEGKDAALLTSVAKMLGFVTTGVHAKKLVPKICKFLLKPDPAMCDADTPEAAAQAAGDSEAEPVDSVQPARSARKRKSAPAQSGRKAKAPRGRRAASAAQAVSAKDDSGMHTLSVSDHVLEALSPHAARLHSCSSPMVKLLHASVKWLCEQRPALDRLTTGEAASLRDGSALRCRVTSRIGDWCRNAAMYCLHTTYGTRRM